MLNTTPSTTHKPTLSSSSGVKNSINPSFANNNHVGDCGTSTNTTTKAENLSKWLFQDIDFIEESLEVVKRKACEMIIEVHEQRKKLQKLVLLDEGTTEGRDTQLKELKMKVSRLRLKIPFKFITPPQLHNPNVNWRPRPNPDQIKEITLPDLIMPTRKGILLNVQECDQHPSVRNGLDDFHDCLLLCFLQFPPDAIIKRSLLSRWVITSQYAYYYYPPFLEKFAETVDDLTAKGFIESVVKKCSLTVAGYRMNHSTHHTLSHWTWPRLSQAVRDEMCLGPSTDKEDYDVFYTGGSFSGEQFPVDEDLRVLHLGKWKKPSTQHIEFIDNPDLFFRKEDVPNLRYISLRGISMIEELPKFITKLTRLEVLDVQACYNLEVIPSDIANLRHTLRHLDMSECYFLEHMPKALATLYNLHVLKGFFVGGEVVDEITLCTLEDLLPLQRLVKLNIYTNVKEFPNRSQLRALQKFEKLRSLTISWGGCKSSPKDQYGEEFQHHQSPNTTSSKDGVDTFNFNLVKLDLQCVPGSVSSHGWLNPANFSELKRLYLRGGRFSDLGQWSEEEGESRCCWDVEVLRLKHLGNLKMDWAELRRMFPKLISFEKVDCPNLHGVPHDEDGVWTEYANLHSSRSAPRRKRTATWFDSSITNKGQV